VAFHTVPLYGYSRTYANVQCKAAIPIPPGKEKGVYCATP